MSFILRRVGFYAVAIWVSITINFFLPRLMPGDPAARLMARISTQLRPEEIDAMRRVFGFSDAPIFNQYLEYLGHILQGDLGKSISRFPSPVTDVIGMGLFWTILLGAVALVISFIVGNVLGIIGTWRRGGLIDSVMPPLLIFVGAFPYFWLAMVALYVLGFQLNLFPLRHAYANNLSPGFNLTFVGSVIRHLILPAGTIVLVSVGGWALGMRNAMVSTLSEDYVIYAEAKGLRQRRIMFNYAARNALLPAVTSLGISIGFILSGALLTEIVFSYPGLGFLLLSAVQNLDYPLLQGLLLMTTMAVLIANFIVDIAYLWLDPRIRVR
ncbi:MAG: ABC transporter permease [Chloroflexi bacterium]|uniref:ABC transporter permease n=1 Tax=Candidatus Flexifilum breve TaxID=3140694 RepID=UPI003135482F|nr:ABC transporter permease [Chloroflexota bacterium]